MCFSEADADTDYYRSSRPITDIFVMTGQRRVDPSAVRYLIGRIKQAKVSGQKTGISEAGQRRKQYQAEVGVTGTGSEFQGRAVRGQTQR